MKRLRAPGFLLVATLVLPAHAGDYDDDLCVFAQRMIVNGLPGSFAVEVLQGQGEGFHTIQMDAVPGTVTIATTDYYDASDEPRRVAVGCKMVNQQRVNDVLSLDLPPVDASCRAVTEATYDRALSELDPTARERYELEGRKLRFADDYVAASGGEWLPSSPHDFIRADSNGLTVTAPAVKVPWNEGAGEFYQGTHHCKLITLSAMREWVGRRAFSAATELYATANQACSAPHSMTSAVGSCRFWFAPAASMFCQDFSGAGWTADDARDACSVRHASPEAQQAAANKYAGAGGLFSTESCATRTDSEEVAGTCVFHCRENDETLWHTPAGNSAGPAATQMMSRACDLYIARDPLNQ